VTVVFKNTALRATVTPRLGGTITALRHLPTGTELLARTPWETSPNAIGFAPDEATWLTRFSGGWPVMFPNAGDACKDGAARHGFHGEGSVADWKAEESDLGLTLTRRFRAVPVTMTRRLTLDDNRLRVSETITAHAPCTAAWGQHVTLGGDLLTGPTTLQTSARRLDACARFTPSESPLHPGATGTWPILPGRHGPVDLSRPVRLDWTVDRLVVETLGLWPMADAARGPVTAPQELPPALAAMLAEDPPALVTPARAIPAAVLADLTARARVLGASLVPQDGAVGISLVVGIG